MHCRHAQRLLTTARDGALPSAERAALDGHVAGCGACREFSLQLEQVAEHLRATDARVVVPDEERAWQDLHREIRAGRRTGTRPWWAPLRWGLPLGAAAALVVSMVWWPPGGDDDGPGPAVARAEFVDVPASSSSVVYVDNESGWLVVWAPSEATGG